MAKDQKQYFKEYQIKNKDKIAERKRLKRINNPEAYKAYNKINYQRNKDKIVPRSAKWRQDNLDRYNAYWKKYRKNPDFKLIEGYRTRISKALKGNKKLSKLCILLGCNTQELRSHLESQFTEGMNWDNYGIGGWEIDHIRPCASFDLSDIEQQKICFHYTNLQPLWASDNRSKSDKWEPNES